MSTARVYTRPLQVLGDSWGVKDTAWHHDGRPVARGGLARLVDLDVEAARRALAEVARLDGTPVAAPRCAALWSRRPCRHCGAGPGKGCNLFPGESRGV